MKYLTASEFFELIPLEQKAVAEAAGIPLGSFNNYVAGRRKLTPEIVAKINKGLDKLSGRVSGTRIKYVPNN